jgi:hypothetical protein
MLVKLQYQAPDNLEITITGGLQRPVPFQESFYCQHPALILRITVDHRRPLQGKFTEVNVKVVTAECVLLGTDSAVGK